MGSGQSVCLLWMPLSHLPHSNCFKRRAPTTIPKILRLSSMENTGAIASSLCTLKPFFRLLSLPALFQGQPKYPNFCLFYCTTRIHQLFLPSSTIYSIGFSSQPTYIPISPSSRKITIKHDFNCYSHKQMPSLLPPKPQ